MILSKPQIEWGHDMAMGGAPGAWISWAMRAIKLIIAGWALAFGAALLLFLGLLWTTGPNVAERVWGALPMSALFIIGLIVAKRFLRP